VRMCTWLPRLRDARPPLVKRDVAGNIAFGSGGSVEYTSEPGDNPAEVLGGIKPVNISALHSISLDGTADELCSTLEEILDRPVVNETNLEGDFEFGVKRGEASASDFLERLRYQVGLIIAPAKRDVGIIIFDFR
jgi:hypothetical protein